MEEDDDLNFDNILNQGARQRRRRQRGRVPSIQLRTLEENEPPSASQETESTGNGFEAEQSESERDEYVEGVDGRRRRTVPVSARTHSSQQQVQFRKPNIHSSQHYYVN